MRILFAIHGWAPECTGGSERYARALAFELARAGHAVAVFAGSMAGGPDWPAARGLERERDEQAGLALDVFRFHRADLFFEHWQKSHSPAAARAFRKVLKEWRPDVVHVHHWLRLTDDLVLNAAREGVPAVVSLGDHFASCALLFRIEPAKRSPCSAAPGPLPCVGCADQIPPRTPWVPIEQRFIAMATRGERLGRELELARARLVPSAAHGQAMQRFLPRLPDWRVLRPAAGEGLACLSPLPFAADGGDRLRLLSLGHLNEVKGTDLILEAIRLSPHADRIEVHLMGGEGDAGAAARLRRAAEGLHVRFHGAYDASELDRHPAARAHAFVSASRAAESHGLVLDEAWRLGLVALLPRAGAFAERAQEGSAAFFHTQGDAQDLARCLNRFFEEPGHLEHLRMGLADARSRLATTSEGAREAKVIYDEAVAAGPPEAATLPPEEWFAERMAEEALRAWDEALANTPAEHSGLPAPP